jgi:ketosteroid isomerase-like protein
MDEPEPGGPAETRQEVQSRLQSYFAACNGGTAQEIAAHFAPDAVVYDTNHPPVRGPGAIGAFFAGVRERWGGAAWTTDGLVAGGAAAAVEWTMTVPGDPPLRIRGSDHYTFEGGLIAEVRQYWTFDPAAPATELRGYPYADG